VASKLLSLPRLGRKDCGIHLWQAVKEEGMDWRGGQIYLSVRDSTYKQASKVDAPRPEIDT
jgi:hypothetical protein